MTGSVQKTWPSQSVERAVNLSDDDLAALCEATNAAIIDGGGFGWVKSPERMSLERYFRGVLLVPERELFLARSEGLIVGSAQLVRPARPTPLHPQAEEMWLAPRSASGWGARQERPARSADPRRAPLRARPRESAARLRPVHPQPRRIVPVRRIFFCNCMIPYTSASAVGGHPGT